MTMAALLTAEDLLKIPSDNLRHQLVKGELITMPPTSAEHGSSSFNIAGELRSFIKAHDLGVGAGAETGFLVSHNPDTVLAPDCAFVRKDRIPATGIPKKYWPFAPDLAVEVLSPSDSASDVLDKINDWIEAGTRMVWIVDPARKTVTIHAANRPIVKLRVTDTLDGQDVLPGFKVPVASIFS